MTRQFTALAIAASLTATVGAGDGAAPRFTLLQATQVRTLGQFTVSPDGRLVAYTVAGHYFEFPVVPRFGEENNVSVVSVETGEIRRVTSGPAPKTAPAFAPGSDRIAYESGGDVWTVSLSDGRESRVTTNGARDSAAAWSPDGRRIAFVSTRGGRSDLWIAAVEGEQYGLVRLTNDELTKSDPQWSPDGRTIAFTAKRSDEYYSQGVFAVPVAGGSARRLTPDDEFDNFAPRWSPSGQRLAFVSDRSGYFHVWSMRPDGSGLREFDSGPYDVAAAYWTVAPVWSPDARHILTSVNREGSYDLLRLSVAEGRVETAGSGGGEFHEVGWARDGSMLYAYENAWSPPDLYVRAAAGQGAARQLTYSSHVAFRPDHCAAARRVRFPSLDGLDLAGFLLTPRGLQPGTRLPGVIALHPNAYGHFTDRWSPFFHYLAESGYVVLLLDQRGSAGYGRQFRRAQIGAWGTKTFDDVKAGAAFLREQSSVDGRLAVVGLSFGGYQALLALTKAPGLFQAGVDLMGPTDRRSPFNDRYRGLNVGGQEEDHRELYDRVSPITSVGDITEPLLILHSDQDRNVEPEHTFRFVAELQRLGKPFEIKWYAGEAHGLADPANQLDSYERILSFLDRHLRCGQRAVPKPRAGTGEGTAASAPARTIPPGFSIPRLP